MTASTSDELIAGFSHNNLPKVTGEPTFEDLKIIHLYLNTNAMNMFSYKGGGQHGHLGLVMTNEEYFTLATYLFTAPESPGATPVIANNTTAAQLMEANRAYKEDTCVYRTYNNVDQAFKKLIIDAFDDQFRNAVLDKVVGYANCMSLDLLTHLLTYYDMIAPTELTRNYERLNAPYDPSQPIESLFQQIQDDINFAVAGGQPYRDTMIVNVAYTHVVTLACFLMLIVHGKCSLQRKRPGSKSSFTYRQHINNFV
jgi:hypothetical protein